MSQNKMAAKIAALLRQAEGTSNEHEASAFMAKAQALMLEHAISEQELAAQDPGRKTRPISVEIELGKNQTGIKAIRSLLAGIADVNRCKVWMMGGRRVLVIAGFQEDVEFVQALFASIRIQMDAAVLQGLPEAKASGMNASSFKTNFMYGYAARVTHRLKAAQKEAENQQAPASTSKALVLRDRKAEVEEYVQDTVGSLRSGPRARHTANAAAVSAGYAAGGQADVSGGRTGVRGGPRGALGR